MTFQISSPEFQNGGPIPKKFTCSGNNVSPALAWTDAPAGTVSFALIMDDPDAPAGTWVHWVLYDIPAQSKALAEGITAAGTAGVNGSQHPNYDGPCPPPGKPHRYFFKLYALDCRLGLPVRATKAQVEQAMQNHILARTETIGTFQR